MLNSLLNELMQPKYYPVYFFLLDLAIVLVKIGFMIALVMSVTALLTWVERKQSALVQDRIGPNRAGILGFTIIGLFQPVADGIKMFTKESYRPPKANPFLHFLAPLLAAIAALFSFSVIPFGDSLNILGKQVNLDIAPMDLSLLFIFGVLGIGVYSLVIAGWVSKSKYAFLGGMRAAAQVISYEVFLGLTVIGLLMIYKTLDLRQMVEYQSGLYWGWLPQWGILTQPLAFLLFYAAVTAENKRIPFDTPEGESEIVGYFTEYSGMEFGLFYMSEYMEVTLFSTLTVILFFGGWKIPYLTSTGFIFPWGISLALNQWWIFILQSLAFCAKIAFFCWFSLMVRWTLPRFRFDQVMKLGWQFMWPLALANLFVTAIIISLVVQ